MSFVETERGAALSALLVSHGSFPAAEPVSLAVPVLLRGRNRSLGMAQDFLWLLANFSFLRFNNVRHPDIRG